MMIKHYWIIVMVIMMNLSDNYDDSLFVKNNDLFVKIL